MPVIPGDNDQGTKDKLAEGANAANAAQQERLAKADEQQNAGPVIVDKMPEPESREVLEKRMQELNKK